MHTEHPLTLGSRRYVAVLAGTTLVRLERPVAHGGRLRTSLAVALHLAHDDGWSTRQVVDALSALSALGGSQDFSGVAHDSGADTAARGVAS